MRSGFSLEQPLWDLFLLIQVFAVFLHTKICAAPWEISKNWRRQNIYIFADVLLKYNSEIQLATAISNNN